MAVWLVPYGLNLSVEDSKSPQEQLTSLSNNAAHHLVTHDTMISPFSALHSGDSGTSRLRSPDPAQAAVMQQ